ncbi:hypothetical protein RIF29_24851 [Crotalaria pallida]|uniref:Uncharacterized protein n=1 Tax=Crotalaria pallida TaxID=3830 RepID=A0AAN9ELB9_CROPI
MMTSGSRNRKSKVVTPVDDESKGNKWRKLVGSMRPFHLQSNESPPHQSEPNKIIPQISLPSSPSPITTTEDDGDEIVTTPTSNFVGEEPYSPSSPPESRYASAVGLNELVPSDEENEKHTLNASASIVGLNELVVVESDNDKEDEMTEEEEIVEEEYGENNGNNIGDEMIDAKADEFIAQFYQQMRLQRFDVVDRRYYERSQRSLGGDESSA